MNRKRGSCRCCFLLIFVMLFMGLSMTALSLDSIPKPSFDVSFGWPRFCEVTYPNPYFIHGGDIDSKPGEEIVVCDWDNDEIHSYYVDSAGVTRRSAKITGFNMPTSVFVADIDGDGDGDILGSSEFDSELAWWENGASWAKHTISILSTPMQIIAGDVDKDGDMDVIGVSSHIQTVRWFENKNGEIADWKENWTEHDIATDYTGAYRIATADINGDGDLDVVAGSIISTGVSVAWFENDGTPKNGGWTKHNVDSGFKCHFIHVADIDGDTFPDILAARKEDDTITLWRNTGGNGLTWEEKGISGCFAEVCAVYSGDFDMDGDLDIAGCSEGNDEVAWFENSSIWKKKTVFNRFDGACGLWAGDIDGDGDMDIAAIAKETQRAAWWENRTYSPYEKVPFAAPGRLFACFGKPIDFKAIDMDRDGDWDILASENDGGKISWFINDGSRDNWVEENVASGINDVRGVDAADMDKDGDMDVLGVSYEDNDVVFWENRVDQGYGYVKHTVDGDFNHPRSVRAMDVNMDGFPDIVGGGYKKLRWWENNGLAAGWNPHDIDTSSVSFDTLQSTDINGDGLGDLVVGSNSGDSIYWYEYNRSTGTFTRHFVADGTIDSVKEAWPVDMDGDSDPDVLGTRSSNISWWESAHWGNSWLKHGSPDYVTDDYPVYPGDLDGDGDMDIISQNQDQNKIQWYENIDGEASSWETFNLDDYYYGVQAIRSLDFDRDGDEDVLAIGYYNESQLLEGLLSEITWWENNSIHRNAAWDYGTVITDTLSNPKMAASSDMDRDGHVDIVLATYDDDRIAWYENKGTDPPGFDYHSISAFIDGPRSVDIGDIDQDGKPDILVASELGDKLVWIRNKLPSTTWAQYEISSNARDASHAVVGDINSDGYLDVIAARQISSSDHRYIISWYENNGAPTGGGWITRSVNTSNAADGPVSLDVADLDGDYDLDVVATYQGSGLIRWFKNSGADTPAFTRYDIASNVDLPAAVKTFDMDMDGDTDVVIASRGKSGISPTNGKVLMYLNDGTPANGGWQSRSIDADTKGAASLFIDDLDNDGDPDVASVYFEVTSTVPQRVSSALNWYEHNGAILPVFEKHTMRFYLLTAPTFTSVTGGDYDKDGDVDLAASTSDNKLTWYHNRGGQSKLNSTETAPATIENGETEDLLKIEVIHNGRTGDSPVELDSLEIMLEVDFGDPMSQNQAENLIHSFALYLDDGSGSFEIGSDTLVAEFEEYEVGGEDGIVTLSLPDNNPHLSVDLSMGSSKTYFLVVTLTTWASGASPNHFRLTHLTENSSIVEDRIYDIPLNMEYVTNLVTKDILATGIPATPTPTSPPSRQELIDYLLDRAGGKGADTNGDGIIDIADIIHLVINQ